MVNPHIGQTVHYTDESGHGGCYAAIVTYIQDPAHDTLRNAVSGEHHVHLTVFNSMQPRPVVSIPADPNAEDTVRVYNAANELVIEDTNFTPGTWHHTH